jgi:hypothetical protein
LVVSSVVIGTVQQIVLERPKGMSC